MNSNEIRNRFISYFKEKKHQFVEGSSIVPDNDPTLLFTNAGMNQFKDVFLGQGGRPYNRAVNSQICVRVSGKHNDLEDVGKDGTHLTSFEMLGNWSFGNYYKKEAIEWAWELLTKEFKIPKYRLVATVFEEDVEAKEIWKTKTDISHDHIVKCDAKDNFWEMGRTGPCGPCSEIHVYLEDKEIDFELNQEILNSGQFIELWNLVFIQFDRQESGELKTLPQTHVDTGAGLERLVAFLQGTPSNYRTDIMYPIIEKITDLTGFQYEDSEKGMPHRVMADHIRTLCFGIADNVFPSNEGRGYVLRRLLRRALRYAKKCEVDEPILYKLVDTVVNSLGDHFTHLIEKKNLIEQVVKAEEESFLKTLTAGLIRFEQVVDSINEDKNTMIDGADLFKLYDTYGFPIDLIAVLAAERKLSIDIKKFETLLENQKQRSRDASQFDVKMDQGDEHLMVDKSLFDKLPVWLSDDLSVAKGGEARVVNNPTDKLSMARHHTATHILHEVLKEECGDHVQQTGSLVDIDRLRFDFSHFESINKKALSIIEEKINNIVHSNHLITIFYSTLEEAKAKGAMALFGEKYDENNVRVVDIGDGWSLECCAGTHVNKTAHVERVKIVSESAVSAGNRRIEAIAGNENIENYLKNKQQEFASKLVKQIENIKNIEKNNKILKLKESINHTVKKLSTIEELERSLDDLSAYQKELTFLIKDMQKKNEKLNASSQKEIAKEMLGNYIELKKNIQLYSNCLQDININDVRGVCDYLAAKDLKTIVIVGATFENKGFIVAKYSKRITEGLSANELIKKVTEKFGGGGGGRFDMAQAGGISVDKIEDVVRFAESYVKNYF